MVDGCWQIKRFPIGRGAAVGLDPRLRAWRLVEQRQGAGEIQVRVFGDQERDFDARDGLPGAGLYGLARQGQPLRFWRIRADASNLRKSMDLQSMRNGLIGRCFDAVPTRCAVGTPLSMMSEEERIGPLSILQREKTAPLAVLMPLRRARRQLSPHGDVIDRPLACDAYQSCHAGARLYPPCPTATASVSPARRV